MDEATKNALLEDVRNRLDITWEDQDTDRKVLGWIEDGVAYLNDKLGEPGDYTVPGFPRTLLFEYVRYARDAALDVFENNYRSLILAMQNDRKVGAYALESAEAPAG
ncbi:MAG: hypothetical protein IKO83_01575 [Oscillospiraceae bacterium]|nr:hypothetical protein [Oscillospiraceae bacterium]MBR4548592.1 hypothetical protein [Oscillospiraceae bacterium]